jgi:hypothetical protein
MPNGEFAPKLVRLIFTIRDAERCFRCGRHLRWEDRGHGWSMHHRRPRGAGGTSLLWVGMAANALTLCGHATSPDGCHAWVETHREEATELGYLIPLNGIQVAEDVAALRWDGVLVELTNWTTAVPLTEAVSS